MLPGLLVSAAALALVLALIDLDELAAAVRQADLFLLIGGGLITLPWLAIRGLFWRTLLQEKASYRDVFLTLNEGYLLNNILPFRLGEVGRALLLGRRAGLDFWQVLPTILIERTLDLVVTAWLFLGTLPFVAGADWAQQAALITGGVFGGGLLLIYLLARNRPRALALVERLGARWPIVQRLAGQRLTAFFDGLAVLTDLRRFLIALGWSTLNWLLGVFQYYVLLLAFFPDAKPTWAFFALGAGALGMAAPSSPGAVGVFEAAMVGALALFSPNHSRAAAFAFAAHLFNYLFTGLIGGYALAKEGETLGSLYRRLRNRE
jgi:hypothetical protein